MSAGIVLLVLIGIVLAFLLTSVKIAKEYERGVVFRLGRLLPDEKGPGVFVTIPGIDQLRMINTQTITATVRPQEVITADSVSVRMDAVVYYRVVDARLAVVEVQDYRRATLEFAQTTLRSVVGSKTLQELLSSQTAVNESLQEIIHATTSGWGVDVEAVEIKDLELPKEMQRAIAVSAEAESEARAKVIAAEGEKDASVALTAAAAMMATQPIALQLRYLQSMVEIVANDSASTIIVPVPIDLLEPFLRRKDHQSPEQKAPAVT